jgi:peptidoglycan/LPS O-acetylase OafA/YrhL
MSAPRGHLPALDGLRGIAILLVLAHAFDTIGPRAGVARVFDLALDSGWIGVQLFFVLSGFLITGILLDTREDPHYLRGFFTRRVLRIFPLYYATLLVAFVIVPLVADVPPDHGDHQVWLWTYLENFAAPLGRAEPSLPHFWSLAVEEQFYLVWPFVVLVGGRRGVLAVGGIMIAIAIAARAYVRARWGADAAYTFTPCRMDALACGAIAAAWLRERPLPDARRANIVALCGGAVVAAGLVLGRGARAGEPMQLAGYTVIAIGFVVELVAALPAAGAPARALAWAPLRRVGTYSYGMYVLHAPLHVYVFRRVLPDEPSLVVALAYAAAATAATFVAAALSYELFERRWLALKDRFAPREVA